MKKSRSVGTSGEKIQKSKNLASASVNLRAEIRKLLDAEIKWCRNAYPPGKYANPKLNLAYKLGFIKGVRHAKFLIGKLPRE